MPQSSASRAPTLPPAFAEHAKARRFSELAHDASICERCDLHRHATQTVFGEGDPDAKIVLVGEQPGDREDIAGKPFVGPAGKLLDDCLEQAGVDRSLCYVTNAVKHFKFGRRGKRRIHSKPTVGEIQRCAWWLGAELDFIRPNLIVALGATALYSLMGRSVGLTKERSRILQVANGLPLLVTIHPSYLLRIPEREEAERERRQFISDLSAITPYLDRTHARSG